MIKFETSKSALRPDNIRTPAGDLLLLFRVCHTHVLLAMAAEVEAVVVEDTDMGLDYWLPCDKLLN